jgi:metallo-beta-lactamase class B
MVKSDEQKRYYANFTYTPPNKIFDSRDGLTLKFGSEEVVIKYYGAGHSVDNLFVFIPSRKVLFGGCAIASAEAFGPGNVSDGSIEEWKKTLNRIDASGYERVIPGHGKIGGAELIEHTKEILGKK